MPPTVIADNSLAPSVATVTVREAPVVPSSTGGGECRP